MLKSTSTLDAVLDTTPFSSLSPTLLLLFEGNRTSNPKNWDNSVYSHFEAKEGQGEDGEVEEGGYIRCIRTPRRTNRVPLTSTISAYPSHRTKSLSCLPLPLSSSQNHKREWGKASLLPPLLLRLHAVLVSSREARSGVHAPSPPPSQVRCPHVHQPFPSQTKTFPLHTSSGSKELLRMQVENPRTSD
ncbi:hypothetical protein BDQ17DRAFT_857322 [Cyathus striatus]|nr:hypothetical protein BDQ17DRAFT_857322 [Cyathus striatus]